MFKAKILTTKNYEEWMEILKSHAYKDPFYLPLYMKAFENVDNKDTLINFGGKGTLFVYGDSRNFIIYPFFRRNIYVPPSVDDNLKHLYDIISPYGYGGALSQIVDEPIGRELWSRFFENFNAYCKESKIVSEFCRLHPIFENHKQVNEFSKGTTLKLGQIIYFDLNYSEEKILADMIHGHRQKVRHALNNSDLTFEIVEKDYQPEIFFHLYGQTMRNVGAENKYFFPLSFFEEIFQSLSQFIRLCRVVYKGNICAELIILKYGDQAYAWLLASNKEYLHLYPNILIVYRSCLKLKQEEIKYFNFGGGRGSKEDSVFQFKAGFSKLRKDYYVFKKIHLPKEYDELVEIQDYSLRNSPDFFPRYRFDGHE